MTYEACLARIHNRKTFSSTASLVRMERLMERLGNPQNQLHCVHVAGTNGKGSVCALVESALRSSGFHTGLFTSPYLVDFRERIRVDGQMISEETLIACYKTVMTEEEKLEQAGFEPINEFELVTALGFLAFARMKVDYAVIEVGLGGRYDATNIIQTPEVSCIMPISLDHTSVLGNTVAEIAAEKAGIIKSGCPVVIAKQESAAMTVLQKTAAEKNSPAILTDSPKIHTYDKNGSRFSYHSVELSIPLLGQYQTENAAAAFEVCRCLGLSDEKIRQGFSSVKWPGRMQYVPGPVNMLIDAGHNPAGIRVLCQTLDSLFPEKEVIAVMAMMRDKDHSHCIPTIARHCKKLIATSISLPRALSPEELASEAEKYCKTETAPSVTAAIQSAKKQSLPGQLVLICGSVYAAGEAIQTI